MILPENIKQRINSWLNGPYDESGKRQIRTWIAEGQHTLLIDSFYKDLEFGTGGLRGELGPGTNRMNIDTIGLATQGFADYLKSQSPDKPTKVVVSHDSRHGSPEFARHVAKVFSANGIEVFLFSEMRPTPLLSFAIRQLGANGGVMVTASHNPKEYNGYKAYWQDGGQLIAPHDKAVMQRVAKITDPTMVKVAEDLGNVQYLGQEIDDQYFEAMLSLSMKSPQTQFSDLKIVYSPLHGTGITLVPELLRRWGYSDVTIVDEQRNPDGDFPTVVYPNPEEPEAMSMGIALAKELRADLVMATDPDADRVGLAIRMEDGEYLLLNGNQIGSLLVYYVLSQRTAKTKIADDDYVVKTIVTTDLIAEISRYFKVPCYEVLTGFKYIGGLMTEKEGNGRFLVGGEESFGYLVGDFVRDKDAVISCAFLAEMADFYKKQGKSLFQALGDLYHQFGFFQEKLVSVTKKGESGAQEIQSIMDRLRQNPPQMLGNVAIREIRDYKEGNVLGLPASDVIQLISVEGDVISARPSGTEPKIKFYCSVKGKWPGTDGFVQAEKALSDKIDRMIDDLMQA